jgi:hypothetical protein
MIFVIIFNCSARECHQLCSSVSVVHALSKVRELLAREHSQSREKVSSAGEGALPRGLMNFYPFNGESADLTLSRVQC